MLQTVQDLIVSLNLWLLKSLVLNKRPEFSTVNKSLVSDSVKQRQYLINLNPCIQEIEGGVTFLLEQLLPFSCHLVFLALVLNTQFLLETRCAPPSQTELSDGSGFFSLQKNGIQADNFSTMKNSIV